MVLKPNKGKPLNKGGGGSPLTGGAIWQLESKGDWHKCDEIDGGDNLRHLLLWPENVANGSQNVEILNCLGLQRRHFRLLTSREVSSFFAGVFI